MDDGFTQHSLQKAYPKILKHEKYEETNKLVSSILKQDWKHKSYTIIAFCQRFASLVFVKDNQALLVNFIELYNYKLSINLYQEKVRSKFNISSIASSSNRYNGISIASNTKDKDKKTLIRSFVFNGLIIYSIWLDKDFSPEVDTLASFFFFDKQFKSLCQKVLNWSTKQSMKKLELLIAMT
ncbi:hypothetical protein BY458DRAFT_490372 [Sporodiniella umbellata]|nr:hypothetical protein BY458DRAFT_490372 [Sporodiniella umbellata]